MIAFVSGGARSGKSAQAEALAMRWHRARGGRLYYLATARATDGEMIRRISRHRETRGSGWTTLEEPVDLMAALDQVVPGSTLLLDCLTLWASQVLYGSGLDERQGLAMIDTMLSRARARNIALVVVSNDVNEEVPPRDAEVRRYLAFLQRLHRRVAHEAELAIQVVAGLPMYWKGSGKEGEAQ
ncbi:adenosylcobinamide kinase/adenosylcobinamide phosphate guanyltransferase [Litchfieldella qijiaojingensis]|uniref:Bifunctional adenosylcobalamin biosynthesis protein n=1 Tax=Litchfieldella qijiaojingensis TaxID=980347 RepID=A0ABQ2YG46_9GAMM|nr:bifunctional adenosylcobinamide kinase/adenosylcobinamide-phosphate guanylyltransferase [Halomonas qijiaojingensis]GGX82532.1 adenosylcobinamide kinase/adenosylcobinamide phosphate guanyltransferase [Halomonas qijiaojingensis]